MPPPVNGITVGEAMAPVVSPAGVPRAAVTSKSKAKRKAAKKRKATSRKRKAHRRVSAVRGRS